MANDPRVTRAGRILRTGFDELPQFFNVFLGQMSLIGPRADPPDAYDLYTDPEKGRLTTKPGISGLAQVNGRTRIPLSQRRAYDLAYVKNQSLWLDTCIFFLTLFELLPFLAWGGRRAQQYLNKTANRLVTHTI
jgi:lipopolysaccharide/colanic/teichoic acid biosynthesis glycosyltransferase